MFVRILKGIGLAFVLAAVVGAGLYAVRGDPWGPISGRQLSGDVVTEPVADWSFTDEHMTIAVETRPAAPHSVTTVCFTHEGQLYVPAVEAPGKSWPHYAVSEPHVRLKIGDKIYPAKATRVNDPELAPKLTAAAQAKYDFPEPEDGQPRFRDVWVFRMESDPDVAAH